MRTVLEPLEKSPLRYNSTRAFDIRGLSLLSVFPVSFTSLSTAQQHQKTLETAYTHPSRPFAWPRTAAEPLIFYKHPDLEQSQVSAASHISTVLQPHFRLPGLLYPFGTYQRLLLHTIPSMSALRRLPKCARLV